ncbi:MAG: polysaccharide pyruvyl transferase family protein [Actinobacteria bacterium]|nr:polysaccharide pyruvyl transferase family protein [Actinomycetota bacterium]
MKKIVLLGSSSGRNAGDAALIEAIMSDIVSEAGEVEFLIPTIKPDFIKRSYHGLPVRPVSMLPWHLSVKMIGLPTFLAIRKADAVLIFDAILFDKSLYNPLFNHVTALALYIPYAKGKNKLTGLYNVSIGPFNMKTGLKLLERIVRNCDFITVRDSDSGRLLESVGVDKEKIVQTSDAALNVGSADDVRVAEILSSERIKLDKPLIGVNINSYLGSWLKGRQHQVNRKEFLSSLAGSLNEIKSTADANLVFFVTQVMDQSITEDLISGLANPDEVGLVSNVKYSCNEIAGVMARLHYFMGMRLHSIILACSVFTPVMGLIYHHKVRSFLSEIGFEGSKLELEEVVSGRLPSFFMNLWSDRNEAKKRLTTNVLGLKVDAKKAATLFAQRIT